MLIGPSSAWTSGTRSRPWPPCRQSTRISATKVGTCR
jgi:hypothetical protein